MTVEHSIAEKLSNKLADHFMAEYALTRDFDHKKSVVEDFRKVVEECLEERQLATNMMLNLREVLEILERVEFCIPDRFDPKEKEREKACPVCGGIGRHFVGHGRHDKRRCQLKELMDKLKNCRGG